MQYVAQKTAILLAILSLVLFSSCERKAADNYAKIKFEFAPAASSVSSKTGDVSATSTNFSGPAASSIADISCYVVLVGGPELRANTCEINTSSGSIRNYYGVVAGGMLRGTSVEVSVPSGIDRVVTLVGFRTNEAGYCPPIHNFDKTKMSDPYVLGEAGALKLEPGATQEVPITMVLDTNKYVKDCQGPDFNDNISGGNGGMQEPDQISTYLPFGPSHITNNMCFTFPIELKKSGAFVQTPTAKTVTVNKVSNGLIYTSVYTGIATTSGAVNSALLSSTFNAPSGIVVASNGDIYVSDTSNHVIRKITASAVTTLAGQVGSPGATNGTGTGAQFNSPMGLALDSTETNLYVADSQNHLIRKIVLSTAVVSTLFSAPNNSGYQDGTGTAVRFNTPTGLVMIGNDLFITDAINHRIRRVDVTGPTAYTLAGSGTSTETDGNGTSATFHTPYGITKDGAGFLYVVDKYGQTVRKINAAGDVTTIAGVALTSGSSNGTATSATFSQPKSIVYDPSQNALLIADTNNQMIRKLAGGSVTTFAGISGSIGAVDSTALASTFNYPMALAVNASGQVFVTDTLNHTIRKIAATSNSSNMHFYNTLIGCNNNVVSDETTAYTIPAGKGRLMGYFKSTSVSATAESFSFADPNGTMAASNNNTYVVQGTPSIADRMMSITTSVNFTNYQCAEVTIYGFHNSLQTTANVSSTALNITPSYAGTGTITFSNDCSNRDPIASVIIPIGERFTTLGVWADITNSFSGTVTLTPSGAFTSPNRTITVSH